MNPFSLENELALITGGGTGLGLAIAQCFIEAGARVVIAGRRQAVLDTALEQLGPAAHSRVFDVVDFAGADDLLASIEREIGPVSILVNNAGNQITKPSEDMTVAEFQAVMDTHVTGAFSLSRAVIPGMKARQHGNILFTASMASLFGLPNVISYSAAKSAYAGMVRTMSVELAAHGVRVNAIAPGWIESDLMRRAMDADPARARRVLQRTPMGHFGEAVDIGWAAVYLCSPAAKFVTGVMFPVDGGVSIGF